MIKLERIKEQEGFQVLRWFEGGGIIASLVKGDFPEEIELRISGRGFNSFIVRGSKEIALKESDKGMIKRINRAIDTKKLFEKSAI